jgi:hypothetical protein
MGRVGKGTMKPRSGRALKCAKKLYDTIATGERAGRTHKTLGAAKKSARFQAAKDGMMVRIYAHCAGGKSSKQVLKRALKKRGRKWTMSCGCNKGMAGVRKPRKVKKPARGPYRVRCDGSWMLQSFSTKRSAEKAAGAWCDGSAIVFHGKRKVSTPVVEGRVTIRRRRKKPRGW